MPGRTQNCKHQQMAAWKVFSTSIGFVLFQLLESRAIYFEKIQFWLPCLRFRLGVQNHVQIWSTTIVFAQNLRQHNGLKTWSGIPWFWASFTFALLNFFSPYLVSSFYHHHLFIFILACKKVGDFFLNENVLIESYVSNFQSRKTVATTIVYLFMRFLILKEIVFLLLKFC